LDFGQFCSNASTTLTTLGTTTFIDTVGVAIPVASNLTKSIGRGAGTTFGINGTTGSAGTLTTVGDLIACTTSFSSAYQTKTLGGSPFLSANSTHVMNVATAGGPEATGVANVVREAKSLVTAPTNNRVGQINLHGAGLGHSFNCIIYLMVQML